MKAKIIGGILLLMAFGLGGSSKNFCGKNCLCGFSALRKAMGATDVPPSAAAASADAEEDAGTPGMSPVNLFMFQIK